LVGVADSTAIPDAFTADVIAPDAFDAMLFVASTTAARKNAGR